MKRISNSLFFLICLVQFIIFNVYLMGIVQRTDFQIALMLWVFCILGFVVWYLIGDEE